MSDFDSFKQSFKGDLVIPTDDTYFQAIARWAANSVRLAAVVAFVRDSEDISLAIKYAISNHIPLAVRGGGHNHGGSSSVEGGLVIDLSRYMNGVRIDAEKNLAFVEGGALWGTVEDEAIKFGLACAGSAVRSVGVGGFTLGGGYGWLTGEHGLAVDNLVRATVVTTSSILTASADDNVDLFFGIRGGGSNFGVVTEFVFKLHPQRSTVFAGPIIFPPTGEVIEKLVNTVNEWLKHSSEKESASVTVTRGPDERACIVFFVFYNGPEAEGRDKFRQFYEIGHVLEFTKEIPYCTVGTMQDEYVPPGRHYFARGASATSLTTSALTSLVALLPAATRPNSSAKFASAIIFEFYHFARTNSVPRNTMAFNSRGPQYIILMVVNWDGGAEDLPWAREVVDQYESAIRLGQDPVSNDENFAYGNYEPDPATSEKILQLYGSNYERLREIKAKYDPANAFNRWFPIEPAI